MIQLKTVLLVFFWFFLIPRKEILKLNLTEKKGYLGVV